MHRERKIFRRALAVSIALHALAAGYVISRPQAAPLPQVLSVTLEAVPARMAEVPAPQPEAVPPEPKPEQPRRARRAAPVVAPEPKPRTDLARDDAPAVPMTAPAAAASPAPVVAAAPAPAAPAPEEPYQPPLYEVAYLSNPTPAYPPQARRRGIEGVVVVRAEISQDGTCSQAKLRDGSGHAVLDQSALEAVRAWRFVPAKRGDRTVTAWVDIPISFRLK
ncbi:MAG TPA: TonB family protein [Burkholderiales bacterium]|nr:TonB family protein [Burkholderiales bacterium]